MIFIGMDVHVRNSWLCVTDENGEVLRRGRCPNRLMELAEFLAPVERRAVGTGEAVRAVLESTTNSRAVQRLLTTYGEQAGVDLTAEVLDARKLRIIAESVTKCDSLDAQVLNEMARSRFKLPVCYMPDDEVFALREHLRARSDLVRLRTMLKNRVHALLHRRGILSPPGGLFTREGRRFLEELSLDEAGRSIVSQYLTCIDQIGERIGESASSLRELARSPRWVGPAALLQTMPGIGLITALTILAELGDIYRFRNRAAVANYAGLVPIIRESNHKCFHGGITRRGPKHLRAVMVEAAWVAVKRVPAYWDLFERVSFRGHKGVAIVAVARRMLEDAWTLLKRNEPFRLVSASESRGLSDRARQAASQAASSVAG